MAEQETDTRCGFVALIGAPNAGKSTLVNQLVGQKVAIVSAKAQTTRARLLGTNYFEAGFAATRDVVHRLWQPAFDGKAGRRKHPKSALQEWAAGNQRKAPEYEVVGRSGPDHAAKFTVRVSVKNVGEVEASASSKQEAETEAARLFMEKFG